MSVFIRPVNFIQRFFFLPLSSQDLREDEKPSMMTHNIPLNQLFQNLWWGDQHGTKQKGMKQYSASFFVRPLAMCPNLFPLTAVSPFQAKAAPHWLRSYIFNGYRRLSGEALFFLVPFGIGAYASLEHTFACSDTYLNRIRSVFMGK